MCAVVALVSAGEVALAPPAQASGFPQESLTVALGFRHTCAIDTANAAWCWGWNANGQIGNNSTTDVSIPTAVTGGLSFVDIAAGYAFTCGITTSNDAYCWGANNVGQLGQNNTTESWVPVAVTGGRKYSRITAGYQHACAITTAGDAYCWGYNNQGQLGEGGFGDSLIPKLVSNGLHWVSIASVQRATCGLTTTQEIYCWGDNSGGQIGDGALPTDRYVPTLVIGSHQWLTLSSSGSVGGAFCAIDTAQDAWCWGAGDFGGLGDGTTLEQPSPVAVLGGYKFASISVGSWHSCGLTLTGLAYCWGLNSSGQIGNGNTTDTNTPVALPVGMPYDSIVGGNAHTCALTTDGALTCWGNNNRGQLGDGTTTTNSNAVVVTGSHTWLRSQSAFLQAGSSTTSVSVDPSFSFLVSGATSTCNGESGFQSAGGSSTAINLGRMVASSLQSAGQTLSISSNAGHGFSVYLRGIAASQSLTSPGHAFADVGAAFGSAGATITGGTEAFGYTFVDATASSTAPVLTSAKFVALDNATSNAIMASGTSSTGTGCVSFAASTSSSTPAGTYTTTIIYTAVPVF